MKRSLYIAHAVSLVLIAIPTIAIIAQNATDIPNSLSDDVKAYCNRPTAYSTGVSDARKGLARKEDYAQVCTVDREIINAAYMTGYQYGLTNQSGLVVNEPAPYHPEVQSQLPSSSVQPYARPVEVPSFAYGYGGGGGGAGAAYAGGPVVSAYSGQTSSSDSQAASTVNYPGERSVPSGDFARPYPTQGLTSLIEVGPSARAKCIQTVSGQACGFNCVNSLNNVRCAASPDQYCRSNQTGDIACGYNCIVTSKVVRCAAFPSDTCVSDTNGYVFCGQNCRITGNAVAVCDIERYAP